LASGLPGRSHEVLRRDALRRILAMRAAVSMYFIGAIALFVAGVPGYLHRQGRNPGAFYTDWLSIGVFGAGIVLAAVVWYSVLGSSTVGGTARRFLVGTLVMVGWLLWFVFQLLLLLTT
jgi:hypothetical protein